MLIRTWRCRVAESMASEYEKFALTVSLPMFRAHEGFRGCVMARRGSDCEVSTFWDGAESVRALDGSTMYRETADRIRTMAFFIEDAGVEIMEVHLYCPALPGDPFVRLVPLGELPSIEHRRSSP